MCNACGDNHTMGTTVSLPLSSSNKVSHEHFSGMNFPANTAALKTSDVLSELGRRYAQKDDKKIFLVPRSLKGLHYLDAFFDIGSSERAF